MPNPNTKKFIFWSVDYILFPLFVVFLAYHPFYKHGLLMTWDEGCPLSWANAVYLHQVPLRDFFVNFGPLFPYLTVLALKAFGNTVAGFRTFMFFGSLAGLVAAYFIVRRLVKSRILLLLFCWYLAAACVIPYWMGKWGGIRCLIMLIPVLLLFKYYSSPKDHLLAVSGAVSGLCFLLTQEAGFIAIAVFASMVLRSQGERLRRVAVFSFSFIAVAAAFYLYLVFRQATLEMFFLNLVESPLAFLGYYNNPPRVALFSFLTPFSVSIDAWLACFQSASFDFIFAVVLFLAGIIYFLKKGGETDKFFLPVFAFGTALFLLGIRGYTGPVISGPQFRWGLAGAGMIGVFFLEKLIFPLEKRPSGLRMPVLLAKAGCILFLFMGLVFSKATPEYLVFLHERFVSIELPKPPKVRIERIGGSLLTTAQAEIFADVTRWIQEHTKDGDYIYAYPHEPHYYFLSGRACPDIFNNSLDAGISRGLQEKAIKNIAKKDVRYAICVNDSFRVMGNTQIANEERIPQIYGYFKKNFFPVARFNGTVILKKR